MGRLDTVEGLKLTYPQGVYSIQLVTIDKWIVLIVAVGAIVALNVSFIRRMNRREREQRDLFDGCDRKNTKE